MMVMNRSVTIDVVIFLSFFDLFSTFSLTCDIACVNSVVPSVDGSGEDAAFIELSPGASSFIPTVCLVGDVVDWRDDDDR